MFDAHCHAWRRWPYDTTVPDRDSRGSIESLLWEMDAAGVERAAVVCARIGGGAGGDGYANEDDNAYVSAFAAAHADRMTAWVDVDCAWRDEYHAPGAADRLRAETDRAAVSGFTHYLREQDDGWLGSDEAAAFFAVAAERRLIASLALSPVWFAGLREIALRHPGLPILVHHLGLPRSDDDARAVLGLADLGNIGVKVSGFNYNSARSWDYPYPDAQDWYRRIAGAFGAHRLFWGSDWPASRDQLTYRQSIEVVREHSPFLSPAELDAVLGGNLERLVADRRMPDPVSASPR
jgi:predicted TIM-barrel fold metal-dependent hydrolase